MPKPFQQYEDLMRVIRQRFDIVEAIKSANLNTFSKSETAAFHGRKIVEGIAFGCLIAFDNKMKHVPRDAKGQWNASTIFRSLKSKNIQVLPNPSTYKTASKDEVSQHNVKAVITGLPELCLTYDDLVGIYSRLHKWLHEINPYVEEDRERFTTNNENILWDDLDKLRKLMGHHFIAIRGDGFFCTLWDQKGGQTKVIALSKVDD